MKSIEIEMFLLAVLIPFDIFPLCRGLQLDFMESLCGTSRVFTTSFQLDSSTGITYKNLLDCTLTVTVPSPNNVLALITRFEMEAALTGNCSDYLNVYDGVNNSSSKLNPADLCGSGSSIPSNFTSSGQSMTLRMVSDSSGSYQGFNIIFAAITTAPCSSSQFACSNTLCIDSSLVCDGYSQCGDDSDEINCQAYKTNDGVDVVMIVVIALVGVAAVTVAISYIAYSVYQRNLWKKYLNSHTNDDTDGIMQPAATYPITFKYYKGIRGHPAYYTNNASAEKDSETTDSRTNTAGVNVKTADH